MKSIEYIQTIVESASVNFSDRIGVRQALQLGGTAVTCKYNCKNADEFVKNAIEDTFGIENVNPANLHAWYSKLPDAEIEKGVPCTIRYYSDSRAATIIDVKRNKDGKPIEVTVAHNVVEVVDYFGGDYKIHDELEDITDVFTLRRGGGWVMKGHQKRDGVRLYIGHHHHYIDPSF